MRTDGRRARPDENLLVLLRHGATANNAAQPPRLQGCRGDPELSEAGREQARRAGEALAVLRIDAVFSSPLRRAVQTAEAVAAPHGLSVELLAAVGECDVGDWEGLSWPEVEAAAPEDFRRFMADPAAHPYAGGESFGQVLDRVAPALDRLLLDGSGRTIVVVAHNVVNRAYLARYLDVPLARARGIPQANGGVNVLRQRGGQIRLLTLNGVLHLDTWE